MGASNLFLSHSPPVLPDSSQLSKEDKSLRAVSYGTLPYLSITHVLALVPRYRARRDYSDRVDRHR